MEYTEEVKKEAHSIFWKYYHVNDKDTAIQCAIQDRQSVLEILYKTGCTECQSENSELIESIVQQIEYLKGKL